VLGSILRRAKPTTYLFGVCLFVFLAHIYASDFKGIWIDEGYRLHTANGGEFQGNLNERHPSDLSSVLALAKSDVHQPLYYVQLNLLLRLSNSYSPIIQYLTNTLLFLLSAAGVFCIARLYLPLEGQLLTILLYSLNGQAMAFALQIREYCLVLCCIVWNVYFFIRFAAASADERKPVLVWLLAGHFVTGILSFYSSFWSLFFFAPQDLLMLWDAVRGRKRNLFIVLSHFLAGLTLIPWLLHSARKLDMKVWDRHSPTLTYLASKTEKGFEFVLTGNVVHHWLPVLFEVMFVILAFAFFGFVLWSMIHFAKLETGPRYVLLACLFFFGFQLGYSALKDPLALNGRYFILYLPFTSLALGTGFTATSKLFLRRPTARSVFDAVCLLGALGIGLLQISQYYHDPDVDHRDDFRRINNYLESQVAPKDDVVVDAIVNARCLRFYSNSPDRYKVGFSEYMPEANPGSHEVWLVVNRPEAYIRLAFDSLKHRLTKDGYRLIAKKRVEKTMILHYAKRSPRTVTPLPQEKSDVSLGVPLRKQIEVVTFLGREHER
jgi:hypothetical protein